MRHERSLELYRGGRDLFNNPAVDNVTVLSKTRRLMEILRWEGVAGLSSILLSEAGYSPVGFYVCLLRSDEAPPSCPFSIKIGPLGEDDIEDYLAFRRGATAAQYLGRLKAGHTCFAARAEGQIASVSWLSVDAAWLDDIDGPMRLEPGEVYLFDSFTAARFRGQRVSARLFQHIRAHFEAAGYDRMVTAIRVQNRPSVRNRERSGFRLAGKIGCLRLGPIAWCGASGAASGRLPAEGTHWSSRRAPRTEYG